MIDHEDDDPVHHRLDLKLWRGMLRFGRPHRRALAGLAASGLLVAICDVLFPRVTGAIIDEATSNQGEHILRYGALFVTVATVLSSTVWGFIILAGIVATGVAHDMRRAAFAKLQELSFSFFDTRPAGWLIARLTTDCDRIASVLPWTLLDAVWGSFLISGITAMMLWMNWRLALVVLSILLPLSIATAIYQSKLIRSQRLARKANSRMTAAFAEAIMGVRTTKAFVREEQNLAEFNVLSSDMFRHSVNSALYAALYLPIVMTCGAAGVGLALWRGGLLQRFGLGAGELVAFMQYAALFHMPIQEMAERFTSLQGAQASVERLQGLLDTKPEIVDAPDVEAADDSIREVAMRNVEFAYKTGEPVLRNFNLTVRAGECIALVGETGSGKSSVAKLICRFYEPSAGEILIDSVDYRRRSVRWLQSKLGIVQQEPHLFSGTIRENIRYGRLDATDGEVEAVAVRIGAATFIKDLPDAYDTQVGEGGSQLSTGQKQLIALARALIADPQILVLDEATSSVDTESERLIQAGIETVLEGRISIIIAHRLSTIRSASRIVVLDRGRIIEEGTHLELLARRGAYARLYSQQFRSEDNFWRLAAGEC